MRKSINHILIAGAFAFMGTASVWAQNTVTGYFLDDYTYRYQMNPALENSSNFFAMPGIGNLNVHINGSLGVQDVLYNVDGRTTTFMNPKISTQEALSKIGDKNSIGLDFSTPVLAFGFKGLGGYNTFTLSAVAQTQIKLPGSVFTLLKEGVSNKTYDIGNIDGFATAYAQLALGHSHQINEQLRVGATLKVLFGAGHVNIDMEHADLELGTDSWRIVTEGEVSASVKGGKFKTDVNKNTGHRYVNGIDIDNAGLGGIGVGIDLGAVYAPEFLPGLKFSAAVLDLGFINWNTNLVASTQGRKVFTTDAYTFNVDDNASNSFDNEFDKIKDDFSALYELSDLGDQGSKTRALGATLNLGAEYTLPMYKAAKFGVLSTSRFNGEFSWTDFRVSANWAPCKIFDASVSTGVGTFGADFGWLLNLHCPGFNLFFGMDNMATKYAKQGVPMSSNGAINLGMNFLF